MSVQFKYVATAAIPPASHVHLAVMFGLVACFVEMNLTGLVAACQHVFSD